MKSEKDLVLIAITPFEVRAYRSGITTPIFYKKHKKSKGLAENFMIGVNNTESKYLVRIDGDDLSSTLNYHIPFYLSIDLLESVGKDYKAAYPFYRIFKQTDRIKNCYGYQEMNLVHYPQGAGIVYERKAFLEAGGYDKKIDMQADLEFYLRFSRFYRFIQSPVIYFWEYTRKNRSLNKKLMFRERMKILEKFYPNQSGWVNEIIPHFGIYAYI